MPRYFLRDRIRNHLALTRLPVGKVGVVDEEGAELAFDHLDPGERKSESRSTILAILRFLVGAGAE